MVRTGVRSDEPGRAAASRITGAVCVAALVVATLASACGRGANKIPPGEIERLNDSYKDTAIIYFLALYRQKYGKWPKDGSEILQKVSSLGYAQRTGPPTTTGEASGAAHYVPYPMPDILTIKLLSVDEDPANVALTEEARFLWKAGGEEANIYSVYPGQAKNPILPGTRVPLVSWVERAGTSK